MSKTVTMIRDLSGVISCLYLLSEMVPGNTSILATIFDSIVRLILLLFTCSLANEMITP